MLSKTTFVPEIYDFINEFKDYCSFKNWRAYNNGDVIKVEHEYHKFFWFSSVDLAIFKNIISNVKCPLCENNSYRMVTPTYMAWVLSEPFSDEGWSYLINMPKLLRKIALFDLNRIYSCGESQGVKLNETKSIVFHEFEFYLKKYGVVFTSLTHSQPNSRIIHTSSFTNSISTN